jgi:hypothetical protein
MIRDGDIVVIKLVIEERLLALEHPDLDLLRLIGIDDVDPAADIDVLTDPEYGSVPPFPAHFLTGMRIPHGDDHRFIRRHVPRHPGDAEAQDGPYRKEDPLEP